MVTRNSMQSRENQAKLRAFLIVVVGLGAVLIITGYGGILPKNFFRHSTSLEDEVNEDIKKKLELPVTPPTADLNTIFYGIMFDAGSTGSRIHVFKFQHVAHGKPFLFIDELFEQVKPGLSSYADDPQKGAKSIEDLLEKAKTYIPESHWHDTPLALKATAGLRLLPGAKADALLQAVEEVFKKCPFAHYDDSVVVMSGIEEGIFSWFSVNFLNGMLGNSNDMVGVMDLGGGSTQITFVPVDQKTLDTVPVDFIKEIDIFGTNHKLYTHSYLGLGLMSGRLRTLGGKQVENEKRDSFSSPCFPKEYDDHWKQGEINYAIKGTQVDDGSRYNVCYTAAREAVADISKTEEFKTKQFLLISYYFDRAVESGLIAKPEGEHLTLQQYIDAAIKVCNSPTPDLPFLCLDLSYITALLQEGFGFEKDKKFMVQKKIRGTEISWALGAMFNLFNTHHIEKKKKT